MTFNECWRIKTIRFFGVLVCAGVMVVGCPAREGEAKTTSAKTKKTTPPSQRSSNLLSSDFEPTRGEATATATSAPSGMFAQPGMADISDNPVFFMVQDKTSGSGVPQDLDNLFRPVLKRLFKDAKLVEEIGEQPPRADGEVEENKLVYVARLLLTEADADQLHKELNEKMKWPASPRLGRKPTHGRKEASMSLFKSTSFRGYSLVITVNYETQRIAVISYRLGSKYDRLM